MHMTYQFAEGAKFAYGKRSKKEGERPFAATRAGETRVAFDRAAERQRAKLRLALGGVDHPQPKGAQPPAGAALHVVPPVALRDGP